MRPSLPCAVAVALVAPWGPAACGDSDPPPRPAPVRLVVSDPGDGATVREDSVEVRGRVAPALSAVTVRGRPVPVSGGEWHTTVDLENGTNLIDVIAGAPDSSPAMTAIRVTRVVTVTVPDVIGDSPEDARTQLEAVGLLAEIDDVGGVFDRLIPASSGVCDTDPGPGSKAEAGAKVRVSVAKVC